MLYTNVTHCSIYFSNGCNKNWQNNIWLKDVKSYGQKIFKFRYLLGLSSLFLGIR